MMKRKQKSKKIMHYDDPEYNNEYGPSFIPLCTGPTKNDLDVTYNEREVTCQNCLKKLGINIKTKKYIWRAARVVK